uniref:Uncharacterized protein n=1 Tax=Oryza meridionalis TaxID=40149 RepID=A0A0E0E6L9_9ORYZ
MGILAYLFLLVVAIIGVFAVLASLLDPIHGFYLRSIKEALEWTEFIFTWTSSLYFILPMVFFSNATNWASTFYDCFTPLTLWLEGIYSGIVLLLFVLFIGNLDENWGRIMSFLGWPYRWLEYFAL